MAELVAGAISLEEHKALAAVAQGLSTALAVMADLQLPSQRATIKDLEAEDLAVLEGSQQVEYPLPAEAGCFLPVPIFLEAAAAGLRGPGPVIMEAGLLAALRLERPAAAQ